MTTNSTAAQSYWDGYTFCSVPAQLYIGGFFRTTGATTAAAQVTATVPAALTDTTGDSIPFSQISWTSSGNGDHRNGRTFSGGTFVNGGVQTVGSMAQQHLERELLDVLLFEQRGAAGRHVHRRRALHDECAMIAAAAPAVRRLFFWPLALTIIWARRRRRKRSPSMIRARRRSNPP